MPEADNTVLVEIITILEIKNAKFNNFYHSFSTSKQSVIQVSELLKYCHAKVAGLTPAEQLVSQGKSACI